MGSRTFNLVSPIVLISLSQFASAIAFTLTDPILPLYASSFHISYDLVGLVLSSFGFARIFCEIPGGILMDRVGRKQMLIVGFMMNAASQLICGLARSHVELAVSRMMIGAGSALELGASVTIIGEASTEGDRQRDIARYQSAAALAQIAGPTVGGVVSQVIGLRNTFFVSAILSASGALVCLKIKSGGREGSDRSGRGLPTASDFKEILGNIRVLSVCVSAFAMFLLFSSIRGTMIPLYGATVLGLNSSEIGLIFSCTSLVIFIVLAFATQRLEEAFGRAGLLTISLVVCSLSVAAMSLPSDFATFIITSIPLGVGLGLLQPTPFAMIIDLSKPANRGLMMGVMRTVADIGVIVGPIIVGSLMNIGQPLLVFYVIAAIIGALSLMTWIVFRRPAERNGV